MLVHMNGLLYKPKNKEIAINSYNLMRKILHKDPCAYIEVTGIKGKFKGVTGIAAPRPQSNLVSLWIGSDDGSDDCAISISEFNKDFIISDIYWAGGE